MHRRVRVESLANWIFEKWRENLLVKAPKRSSLAILRYPYRYLQAWNFQISQGDKSALSTYVNTYFVISKKLRFEIRPYASQVIQIGVMIFLSVRNALKHVTFQEAVTSIRFIIQNVNNTQICRFCPPRFPLKTCVSWVSPNSVWWITI